MTNEEKKQQAIDLQDNWVTRAAAVRLGNLTTKQHDAALSDDHWFVRYVAVSLGGLSKEQRDHAKKDKHEYVRAAARQPGETLFNPNVSSYGQDLIGSIALSVSSFVDAELTLLRKELADIKKLLEGN